MALEIEITKLTAAVEKQNGLLEKLLSAGAKNTATAPADKAEVAAPASEDKPKTTKAKAEKPAAETKAETPEITVETLTAKFKPWLGEFASDHPETAARKVKFKEVLTKLGAGKLSEITDPAKLLKLDTWFREKALTWDEGHGIGRFAPDESSEPEDGDDDL